MLRGFPGPKPGPSAEGPRPQGSAGGAGRGPQVTAESSNKAPASRAGVETREGRRVATPRLLPRCSCPGAHSRSPWPGRKRPRDLPGGRGLWGQGLWGRGLGAGPRGGAVGAGGTTEVGARARGHAQVNHALALDPSLALREGGTAAQRLAVTGFARKLSGSLRVDQISQHKTLRRTGSHAWPGTSAAKSESGWGQPGTSRKAGRLPPLWFFPHKVGVGDRQGSVSTRVGAARRMGRCIFWALGGQETPQQAPPGGGGSDV